MVDYRLYAEVDMANEFYIKENKGVTLLKSGVLEREYCVRHCFTTRLGGVSGGCYASTNMGFSRGEDRDTVMKNYRIVCDAAGLNFGGLTKTYQKHSIKVTEITGDKVGSGFVKPELPVTDAVITNLPGVPLVCHTADCVPVLLYDRKTHAIAAIHAGWRGMADGIIEETIGAMEDAYDTDPADLVAAVGPCIGPCCFEVDSDVAERFRSEFGDGVIIPGTGGNKTRIDLPACARDSLSGCGLDDCNIDISNECTKCKEELYYSHRRTGDMRGTLAGIIQTVKP